MMKLGVQYYPEHWPEERWKTDAELMRRAGLDLVRMGEFAWSAYEQEERTYTFEWMENAIVLLGDHGIKTILCTCSRTPPPWVYKKYPAVGNTDIQVHPLPTDHRYRIGLAHPDFQKLSQRIDREVVTRFSGNPNVVAWQVDNEVGSGNDCYCARCVDAFREFLKEKYGTPAALNDAWGTHFWSFTFNSFDEVPAPGGTQPQLALEYRRFMSHVNTEFTRWRADLIHELDPGKPVTTNFQNIYAAHTDCHGLKDVIDVNGMNHYPARTPELALDYYRGKRGTVWALEQHTRLQRIDTPDGWMRLWAWMAAAHGAGAVVHFRWRQCRWGNEQFADGILPHAGQENRFYRDLERTGNELKKVKDLIEPTCPRSRAAVVYAYDSRWGVQAAGFERLVDPVPEADRFHMALARRLTAVDAMDPREDLSDYDLVIAPRLWLVDTAITESLTAFVGGGGTLCLTCGTGVVDRYGKSFDTPRPGPLRDLAGVTVSDLAYDPDLQVKLRSDHPALDGMTGTLIADEIHPDTARTEAVHKKGWRKGSPAVTIHPVGKGQVIYVGIMPDEQSIPALADWLCGLAGIPREFDPPEGMRVYERICDAYRLLFLINWTGNTLAMPLPGKWKDALTGETAAEAEVPAEDIRILKSL